MKWYVLILLGLLFINCDSLKGPAGPQGPSGEQGPPGECIEPEPKELFITRISGNEQYVPVGTSLVQPFIVLINDENGKAVANQRIDFIILNGSVTLSAESQITDINGIVEITLTVGDREEEILLEARIFGTDKSVIFTVTSYIPYPVYLEGIWTVTMGSRSGLLREGDSWTITNVSTEDGITTADLKWFSTVYDENRLGTLEFNPLVKTLLIDTTKTGYSPNREAYINVILYGNKLTMTNEDGSYELRKI